MQTKSSARVPSEHTMQKIVNSSSLSPKRKAQQVLEKDKQNE